MTTGAVGVVDSGVRASHPDLAGNVLAGGYDFIGYDTNPTDENGHGTAVAGNWSIFFSKTAMTLARRVWTFITATVV